MAKNVRGIDSMSALRVSFLEQSAALLGQLSTATNDLYSNFSSHCSKELREFSYVEQVRSDQSVKRSQCSKCRICFVPNRNGQVPIKVAQKKKRIIRTCLNCNHKVSYLHNTKYLSRNEKAEKESEQANKAKLS